MSLPQDVPQWHLHCLQSYCSEEIPDILGTLPECYVELEKHEIFPNGEIKPGLLEQEIELTHVDNSGAHACRWMVKRVNSVPLTPTRNDHTEADIASLLAQATLLAKAKTGGHLTIMRFTTGWKVMLGTPNLDTGKDEMGQLICYSSMESALQALLVGL